MTVLHYPASILGLVLIASALAGCAEKPPPYVSHNRLYFEDQNGKAPSCTVSDVKVTDGKETPVTMTTGGGGWCAVSISHGGDPYGSSLLVQAPRSGKVFVHPVGDDTRIDYTPKSATSPATDSFAVRLIPGDAVIRVAVNPPETSGKVTMKRTVGCLVSLNLLLAGPAMAAGECSSPGDQAAFDVGALKSELSILAIACSNQDQYNQFVERYRSELVAEDHVVNAWFDKTYGRTGRTHYDSYITLLANEQSNVGQHQGSDFCPRLGVLFSEAMAVPDLKLLPQYAAAKDLIPASLGSCEPETASVSKPGPRRSAAKKK